VPPAHEVSRRRLRFPVCPSGEQLHDEADPHGGLHAP